MRRQLHVPDTSFAARGINVEQPHLQQRAKCAKRREQADGSAIVPKKTGAGDCAFAAMLVC
jgi:hypothetical protein